MQTKPYKPLLILTASVLLVATTVQANRSEYFWGGIAGAVVGASLSEVFYQDRRRQIYSARPREIRYHRHRSYPSRYRGERCPSDRDMRPVLHREKSRSTHRVKKRETLHKSKSRKHRHTRKTPTHHNTRSETKYAEKVQKPAPSLLRDLTVSQKVQKGLLGLGFYQGVLDGEMQSYQTHAALRSFYRHYEIDEAETITAVLRNQLKNVGELFLMDHALLAKSHTAESQIKQLQCALKIHGYYADAIDGLMGEKTREAILAYKKDKGLDQSPYLDLESKYHLVKSAKKKNEAAIDGIVSLWKPVATAPKESVRLLQPSYRNKIRYSSAD